MGISLNPILNSFQHTVKEYNITDDLIQSFLKSMKMDLIKSDYHSKQEYDEYIYGSADVVGLMCLKVFVKGDDQKYERTERRSNAVGFGFSESEFLKRFERR